MSIRSELRKNNQVKMHAWGGYDTYQLHLVKSKILAFPEKDELTLKTCSVFNRANATREEIGVG